MVSKLTRTNVPFLNKRLMNVNGCIVIDDLKNFVS